MSVLPGIGAAAGLVGASQEGITAAISGIFIGYSNGGSGAGTFGSSTLTVEHHGYTIDAAYDETLTPSFNYHIEGNHTGNQFTSVNCNGATFLRTAADSPNGTFDAGSSSTQWMWSGTSAGMLNVGQVYSFSVTP